MMAKVEVAKIVDVSKDPKNIGKPKDEDDE